MQLIKPDGLLNLELIDDQESFSLKEQDLSHTSLVNDLKKNSCFNNFHIQLTIASIGDNSFTLKATTTGILKNTCGRCIRDFSKDITIDFEEILLFTKKSARAKKQEASNKDKLSNKNISDSQHHNLGLESDVFVQEITDYKFGVIQWLYENIIIAINETNNICKKSDCESIFQNLLKTTNTNYKTAQSLDKPNTHKVFADLLKPLKKH